MSYIFLAASGEASSRESFAEMFRCAPWKSTQDAGKYYCNGNAMEYSPGFRYGTTLKHSTESLGVESCRKSARVSLASEFQQLELITTSTVSSAALMTKALDFTTKCQESLRKFNLTLCNWKTPRIYEPRDLCESSTILPAWGMMQDGVCLGLGDSARIISENECILLPTPTRHNAKEGAYPAEYTRHTPTLAAQIGGKINPDWNEWRMGVPIKWGDLQPLEMHRFQEWLRLHGRH